MKNFIFSAILLFLFLGANAQGNLNLNPTIMDKKIDAPGVKENPQISAAIYTPNPAGPDYLYHAIANDKFNGNTIQNRIECHGIVCTYNLLPAAFGGSSSLYNPNITLQPSPIGIKALSFFEGSTGSIYQNQIDIPLNFSSTTVPTVTSSGLFSVNASRPSTDGDPITHKVAIVFIRKVGLFDQVFLSIWGPSGAVYGAIPGYGAIQITNTPTNKTNPSVGIGSDNNGVNVTYYLKIACIENTLPFPLKKVYSVVGNATGSSVNISQVLTEKLYNVPNPVITYDVNYPRICAQRLVTAGQQTWTMVCNEMDGVTSGLTPHLRIISSDFLPPVIPPFTHLDNNPGGPFGTSYNYCPVISQQSNKGAFIAWRGYFFSAVGGNVFGVMNPFQSPGTAYQDWKKVNFVNSFPSKMSIAAASDTINHFVVWYADERIYYKDNYENMSSFRLAAGSQLQPALYTSNTHTIHDAAGRLVYSGDNPDFTALSNGIYIVDGGTTESRKISVMNGQSSSSVR